MGINYIIYCLLKFIYKVMMIIIYFFYRRVLYIFIFFYRRFLVLWNDGDFDLLKYEIYMSKCSWNDNVCIILI